MIVSLTPASAVLIKQTNWSSVNTTPQLKDEKAELKKEIFDHIKYIGELEYQLRRARGETG